MIRSRVTYASPVWRPHLVKDFTSLERVQRQATIFILNDYQSDYRSRLISLNLLPLMMTLEIYDILFFIKNYQQPQNCFDITTRFTFSCSSTRVSTTNKLSYNHSSNSSRYHFFNRLPRLWNALPPLDLSLPPVTLKNQLKRFFWSHFISTFNPNNPCTFHLVCPCNSCSSLPTNTNYSWQPVHVTGWPSVHVTILHNHLFCSY